MTFQNNYNLLNTINYVSFWQALNYGVQKIFKVSAQEACHTVIYGIDKEQLPRCWKSEKLMKFGNNWFFFLNEFLISVKSIEGLPILYYTQNWQKSMWGQQLNGDQGEAFQPWLQTSFRSRRCILSCAAPAWQNILDIAPFHPVPKSPTPSRECPSHGREQHRQEKLGLKFKWKLAMQ